MRDAVGLTNLMVQAIDNQGPNYVKGWDFFPTDLNSGVGGKFIYVGYQTGDQNPVTSITFKSFDDAQEKSMEGWQWSGQDLNQGAGGAYIYMYWKTGELDVPAIKDLLFLVISNDTPPSIDGWISIRQDLNQGAGGPYIWPYYSNTITPGKAKVKMERSK